VRAFASPAHADLQPDPAVSGPPEAQAEATREWSERLQRAHANDGEFSMLRTLLADLPRSRTPWEQVLRTLLARALSLQRGVSWSRPSRSYIANQGRTAGGRRLPWEPGFSATTAVPRLVLVIDVSGSIPDALMASFSREIVAIVRRLESSVVLLIGDDRVRHVIRFEPGRFKLEDIRFEGGGGTDFDPLLEEADRHAPDITVVLTDLDGPARQRPRAPVVWAVPEAFAAAVPPFGRVLVLR
jgi:predicted metal-dependent peptidase